MIVQGNTYRNMNKCYKIDFSAIKCFHEYMSMVSIC